MPLGGSARLVALEGVRSSTSPCTLPPARRVIPLYRLRVRVTLVVSQITSLAGLDLGEVRER